MELDIDQPWQNLPRCTHQPAPLLAQQAEIGGTERLPETNQKLHRAKVTKDKEVT